ncbi:MAG: hypothetical protein ACI4GZ_04310 [Ruminococcus sp.]
MVKKLFKHEIMALGRMIFPVLCAVLGAGLLTRFVVLFETDSVSYKIVIGSSVFILIAAILTSLVLAVVLSVVRYYKNLFTSEGYLSFTLPVTPANHLWVKSLVALMFVSLTALTAVVSVLIAASGEPIVEVFKALSFLWKLVTQEVQEIHLVLYIIEFLGVLIAATFYELFLFYTCITVGQLAKKNRIFLAVGVYFGYYVVTQVIATIFTVLFAVFGHLLPLQEIAEFIDNHTVGCIHAGAVALIAFYLVLSGICFVISHSIIRKRLNIE